MHEIKGYKISRPEATNLRALTLMILGTKIELHIKFRDKNSCLTMILCPSYDLTEGRRKLGLLVVF